MRETQIVVWCDACQAKGRNTKLDENHHHTIDLGGGPLTLDLCAADRKALIDPLAKLLDEYGVPVTRTAPKPKSVKEPDEHECPRCHQFVRGSRRNLISHLTSVHNVDAVAASKLVPTASGRSVPCPVCGYITDGGTGMAGHVRPVHGEDMWKKIKAERAAIQ